MVVGVDSNEVTPEDGKRFARGVGVTFPNFWDNHLNLGGGNSMYWEYARALFSSQFPMTVVARSNGVVVFAVSEPVDLRKVDDALKEAAKAAEPR
ncbi:MAG: hypothetical protein M3R44_07805 [Candidatus Eremiobacteraeota bacterium]|nr:hypothetical protein [Candidatus Eremiobacteraeota bacterium]